MRKQELQLMHVPVKITESGEGNLALSEQSEEVKCLMEELEGLKTKIVVLQGNIPAEELTNQYLLLAEILQQERQYSKSLQAETEALRNDILDRMKSLESEAEDLCW